MVGCAFALFGAALQTAAQNVAWMICSRIITGIGTGHLNAIVPVWSAETSHYASRGMFIAMEFTLNIFGVVIAVSIGWVFHKVWYWFSMADISLSTGLHMVFMTNLVLYAGDSLLASN